MISSGVPEFGAFQKALLAVYDRVKRGEGSGSDEGILAAMRDCQAKLSPAAPLAFFQTFDRFAQLISLNLREPQRSAFLRTLQSAPDCAGPVRILGELPPLRADGDEGISLVTCCMNRGDNLVRSLRSWLAIDRISEVVIVDWSSRDAVADRLKAEGIADPRLRVIRVDGEPRWILSYAFNVGFRAASRKLILKADADIVIAPDFLESNTPTGNDYIAGNWQDAAEDQAFVNGFFFAPRRALQAVGGFNEFITSYGWDDDDLYHRLTTAGFIRRNVLGRGIFHLEHTDAERIADGEAEDGKELELERILSGTAFHIQRNRALVRLMPQWSTASSTMGYNILEQAGNVTRLVRQSLLPRLVPRAITEVATLRGLREVASWHVGEAAHRIPERALRLLLSRPRSEITKIDIAIAQGDRPEALRARGPFAILDIPPDMLAAPPRAFSQVADALIAAAAEDGLRIVLRSAAATLSAAAPAGLHAFPLIRENEELGEVDTVGVEAFLERTDAARGRSVLIRLDENEIGKVSQQQHVAPPVIARRRKIFVDVQHGLGNRLRAIASAAAIAAASERDLIIVWQGDHHCDCEFRDLYDYTGPVVGERFIAAADELGMDVFNYMPGEANARKDAEIVISPARDLYLRSAFIFNHPASTREAENRFLRELKPVAAIRALVASVDQDYRLAAHIRMEGAPGQHLKSYDDRSNWSEEDHRLIQHSRSNSNAERFMQRIDALMAQESHSRFFLAADLEITYRMFEEKYGDKVLFLRRGNFDRSPDQLRHALADAMLLGHARHLLASTWSSFSELAIRLAPQEPVVEHSGTDF